MVLTILTSIPMEFRHNPELPVSETMKNLEFSATWITFPLRYISFLNVFYLQKMSCVIFEYWRFM